MAKLPEVSEKMDKTLNVYNEDLKRIRAGRANPAILDKVTVDYYGTATPIPQVGNVSVPEARTIIIQPWDASILTAIEKAIQTSDIGINPNNDGKVIRLNFPPLTEDRRKEIVKEVKKRAEDAKVALRSIRRDAIENYKAKKKASEITEDDLKGIEKDIQTITDNYVKEVDTLTAAKEKEIMEV
ncbi:MAG: ribosome recycling factor [Clostridia bacterium]|nr:ribosome recycling factor [Clostridia bacterium]